MLRIFASDYLLYVGCAVNDSSYVMLLYLKSRVSNSTSRYFSLTILYKKVLSTLILSTSFLEVVFVHIEGSYLRNKNLKRVEINV